VTNERRLVVRIVLFAAAPLAVITGGILGALLLPHDGYVRGVQAACLLLGALLALWILSTLLAALPARGVPSQEEMRRMLSIADGGPAKESRTWRRWRLVALALSMGGLAALGALALEVDDPGWIFAPMLVFFVGAVAAMRGTAPRAAAEDARELAGLGLTGREAPPAHREAARPAPLYGGRLVWPKDTIYTGVRRGRAVTIRLFAEGASLVRVEPLTVAPSLRVSGGRRLRAELAPFPALAVAAASLPESAAWEGSEVSSGPVGIEISRSRRGRGSRFWFYDLWLAERLAHAVDGGGAA
jgi:hypothetical protein